MRLLLVGRPGRALTDVAPEAWGGRTVGQE